MRRAIRAVSSSVVTASRRSYLVTIWASRCFRDFAINDTVSKRLKGRWQNIIRPLGVVAVSLFMFSCFLHVLFDCFWYRRQGLVEDGGDSVPADGGGGPVAAEGEELEPPADGGGNAPPANEERVHIASHAITIPFNTDPESPPASPAPAPAQTTSQSTNVRNIDTGHSWTAQEYVDNSQGQRNSG